MFGLHKKKIEYEPPPRKYLENFECRYCGKTGEVNASDLICGVCMHDNHREPTVKKKKMKPLEPFDFTIYEKEREEGLKLFCAVCGQRFDNNDDYLRHHLTNCAGKGA